MIRTRFSTLSLVLFLLLSGGASSASKGSRSAPVRAGSPAAVSFAGAAAEDSKVLPAVRILRGPERTLLGAGECPTGIEVELWPPNHKVVEIDLEEVLGPDVVAIEILSITQDEPVDDRGDGNTECDGDGVSTSVARIRAERGGRGNGRVYEIEYSAFNGGCTGFIHVLVPHDQSGRPAEDDGQLFDSTEGCP